MTMLSDEELAAIRGRLAAATPGPWSGDDEHGLMSGADPAWCVSRSDADGGYHGDLAYVEGPNAEADAVFMAATRLDVPALLAHIDALTAQRDRARSIAVSLEQELARYKAHEAYFRGFQPPTTTVEVTEQRAAMMATVDAAIDAKLTDPSRPGAPIAYRTLDALLGFRVTNDRALMPEGHTGEMAGRIDYRLRPDGTPA